MLTRRVQHLESAVWQGNVQAAEGTQGMGHELVLGAHAPRQQQV